MRKDFKSGFTSEWTVFAVFIAAYVIISAFHEPWFDEAQAWQIAKCASLKDILFEIPHYEGHPPLWYLILMLPAKAGVPFETGLKVIGFFISAVSVYLILFKMPYPRLIRLLLPFSYFVFYQYGIIVRPYGLMILLSLLLVILFPQKNTKPFLFISIMALLCATSAYGIVMAGGISIAIVWDLLKEKGIKCFFAEVLTDKRTIALGLLLFIAILLILDILPRKNTFYAGQYKTNPFLLCWLCALLTFLPECLFSSSTWFGIDRTLLQTSKIEVTELVVLCFVGLIIWGILIGISSKKALKYLLVPYGLFSVFSASVYFSAHHLGIALMIVMFWMGIVFQEDDKYEIGGYIAGRVIKTEKDQSLIKKAILLFCAIGLIIPIYWTVSSSVMESNETYGQGRAVSAFIKKHGLEESLMFAGYGYSLPDDDAESSADNTQFILNTYFVPTPVVINAYFDHNLCMNLNYGNDAEAYMHYKEASIEEREMMISEWKEAGVPDIILGKAAIGLVYDTVSYNDYAPVEEIVLNTIWKGSADKEAFIIYARKDILDKYGLTEIVDEAIEYWNEGFRITDEMREQYQSGVPVEELLKPYLDKMLGAEEK